ncbi:spike base protein, RCAP_Rcc01079 family [Rhizobium ecuadorense]|uniref:spike base protein, RCAP_Rcc01079 family n=1 Tax=Rhizobium ecuadorense TaxID=1671795 RepID=UPI000AFA6CDD
MASPEWNGGGRTATSFGRKGAAITPGATDLDPIAKAVVMTTTGDITIVPADNATSVTITFTACPVGFIPPYQVRRVTACTGTCASVDA